MSLQIPVFPAQEATGSRKRGEGVEGGEHSFMDGHSWRRLYATGYYAAKYSAANICRTKVVSGLPFSSQSRDQT